MRGGVPQFDLGPACDVLDGCPKAIGAMQLVRTMGPQAVAMDEITDPADLAAVQNAAGCGVAVLATIHARDEPSSGASRCSGRCAGRGRSPGWSSCLWTRTAGTAGSGRWKGGGGPCC